MLGAVESGEEPPGAEIMNYTVHIARRARAAILLTSSEPMNDGEGTR